MSHYGKTMNGHRSARGTITPSAAARPGVSMQLIPAMTAASGMRTPNGHGPSVMSSHRRPGALPATATYGGRHAYVDQLRNQVEMNSRAQRAVEDAFGADEPEVDLEEIGALLDEADELLYDIEAEE